MKVLTSKGKIEEGIEITIFDEAIIADIQKILYDNFYRTTESKEVTAILLSKYIIIERPSETGSNSKQPDTLDDPLLLPDGPLDGQGKPLK